MRVSKPSNDAGRSLSQVLSRRASLDASSSCGGERDCLPLASSRSSSALLSHLAPPGPSLFLYHSRSGFRFLVPSTGPSRSSSTSATSRRAKRTREEKAESLLPTFAYSFKSVETEGRHRAAPTKRKIINNDEPPSVPPPLTPRRRIDEARGMKRYPDCGATIGGFVR